jgi:hypothetical protein
MNIFNSVYKANDQSKYTKNQNKVVISHHLAQKSMDSLQH